MPGAPISMRPPASSGFSFTAGGGVAGQATTTTTPTAGLVPTTRPKADSFNFVQGAMKGLL